VPGDLAPANGEPGTPDKHAELYGKDMALRQGRLIVICGTDGSGKTAQTRLLAERLRCEGYRVRGLHFPQYEKTFFGRLVRRYLRGEFGSADGVSPYLASLLYAGDRWQAKEDIERWLAEGDIVLCDRYVSANQGHQGCKIADPTERDEFLAWLDELEFQVFGIPRPDMHIFLFMPYPFALRLLRARDGRGSDIHERDEAYLRQAEATYLQMAERFENWSRIDCVVHDELLSPGQIAERVWAVACQYLPPR